MRNILFIIIFILTFPFSVLADGTVTFLIGNGVGSYSSAIDDYGSWGGVSSWGDYYPTGPGSGIRTTFPGLDALPGSNRTVISASYNLYFHYEPSGLGKTYTLNFFNAREGDSSGTPIYTYTPWMSKPTAIYYDFPIPNSTVQAWIDTPASNNGVSMHISSSDGGDSLEFGAVDNIIIGYRPTLSITYTYTGDIAPPVPIFTGLISGWKVKGTTPIQWEWSINQVSDTSTAKIHIQIQPEGGSWSDLATNVTADDMSWNWDTSPLAEGNYNLRIRSESVDGSYSIWTTTSSTITITSHDFDIVQTNNLIKIKPQDIVTIPDIPITPSWFAAKGEAQDAQLVFIPHRVFTNLQFSTGEFSDGQGHTIPSSSVTLYVQQYTDCTALSSGSQATPGIWPDALIPVVDPVWGESRSISNITTAPNFTNIPLILDIVVPQGQTAGVYTGNFIVNADGISQVSIPCSFRVRNFSIPATSSLKNTNIFDNGRMSYWHTNNNATRDTTQISEPSLWLMYRDFFLKYRQSVNNSGWNAFKTDYSTSTLTSTVTSPMYTDYLNYPSGDSATVSYPTTQDFILNTPTVNGSSQTWPGSDASIVSGWTTFAAYRESQGWNNANVLRFTYAWDEPHTSDFISLGQKVANIKAGDPTIKTLVTSGLRTDSSDGTHSLAYYQSLIDIFSPYIGSFELTGASDGGGIDTYDTLRSGGHQVFFYTSNTAPTQAGVPNWNIDFPDGEYARIMPWLAWFYTLDGILYFDSTASWKYSNTDPYTQSYQYGAWGDGTLFYPGSTGIIGGSHGVPVPSLRLNYIRNGYQDYEYLKILNDLGYSAYVNSIVSQLIPVERSSNTAIRNWVHDPELMQNIRIQMADVIESGFAPVKRYRINNTILQIPPQE